MKRALVTCIECAEYPRERYIRRKWGTDQVSRTAEISLAQIRETGADVGLAEQRERHSLV